MLPRLLLLLLRAAAACRGYRCCCRWRPAAGASRLTDRGRRAASGTRQGVERRDDGWQDARLAATQPHTDSLFM
jgi:hypothetical protein